MREFSVSSASVRNWLRLGYLARSSDRLVDRHSLDQFVAEVAGVEKLTGRANKQLVDQHDHAALQATFRDDLETSARSGDEHSGAYEASLSDSFRNKEGIYYTPRAITESFFRVLPDEDRSQMTFCDPCWHRQLPNRGHRIRLLAAQCFLVLIPMRPPSRSPSGRMLERTGIACDTIDVRDFLQASVRHQHERQFDVVFTNLPWGKKLPKGERQKFGRFDRGSEHRYLLALLFGCRRGGAGRRLSRMLLPDAFFNIAAFEDVRRRILSYRILSLADFGKPFSGLLTRARGVTVWKVASCATDQVACRTAAGEHMRTQMSFAENPKGNFNLNLAEREDSIIRHIFCSIHTGRSRGTPAGGWVS
ncbi:MAG: hypothetical protein R3F39_15250 [Myxococcota bacterium]